MPNYDTPKCPAHYAGKIEPWAVIEAGYLPFLPATAFKYVARYKRKGAPLNDIIKARHCLLRHCRRLDGDARYACLCIHSRGLIPSLPDLSGLIDRFLAQHDDRYARRLMRCIALEFPYPDRLDPFAFRLLDSIERSLRVV